MNCGTACEGTESTAARGWAISVRATNLYTASTVVIDVATGRIRGHHQYHPNDSWDWDEVSLPILVHYTRQGRTITGLIDVARNGYLWFLERSDGPIRFVEDAGHRITGRDTRTARALRRTRGGAFQRAVTSSLP